jgi:hypothetical protein
MRSRPLEKIIESSPGPAMYNPNDLPTRPKSPSYKFNSETREKIIKDDNPSPTSYNIDTKEKGPLWSFGTEKRETKTIEKAPGPGQYTPQETQFHSTAPIFPTSSRTSITKPNESPGVGTYEIRSEKPEGPQFTMGVKPLEKIQESTPAPNFYHPETGDKATRPKSPEYKFGTEKRENLLKETFPAPGDYDVQIKDKGYQWKFSSEPRDHLQFEQTPGPGFYSPRESNKPGFAYTTSERPALSKALDTPGVGTYEVKEINQGVGYSITGRPVEKIRESSPGPGAYSKEAGDLATRPKSPSYRFGTESREQIIKNENPSPNTYNIEPKEKGPTWVFSTGERNIKKLEKVPGPGEYSPKEINPHSSAPVFGSSKRTLFDAPSETPGVGTYEIRTEKTEGPQFTMGVKQLEKNRESSPGPGEYDHNNDFITRPKSPQYQFPKESLNKDIKDHYPAPGTYDVNYDANKGPSWKFSNETRLKDKIESSPGPGEYYQENIIKSTGFYISTAERPTFKENETPGVGTYEVKGMPEGPMFSMQGRQNEKLKESSPGPTTYNKETSDELIKPKSPSHRFGTEKRLTVERNENPAPGDYEINFKDKGIEIRFGTEKKNKEKVEITPGPGEYSPGNLKEKSQGFGFGSSERPGIGNFIDTPGVGSYEVRAKPEGPYYSLAGRPVEKIKESNVSPASYYPETGDVVTRPKSKT